jgi:hypothetical protein
MTHSPFCLLVSRRIVEQAEHSYILSFKSLSPHKQNPDVLSRFLVADGGTILFFTCALPVRERLTIVADNYGFSDSFSLCYVTDGRPACLPVSVSYDGGLCCLAVSDAPDHRCGLLCIDDTTKLRAKTI